MFAFVLLAGYIYAFLLPGQWYGEVFLYRQGDGSFAGGDRYAAYRLYITAMEDGAEIIFAANNAARQYRVTYDAGDVRIEENAALVFQGHAQPMGDTYLLMDDQGQPTDMIRIMVEGIPLDEEDLYPSLTQLYSWAVAEKHDIRGNPSMLLLMVLTALVLGLDVAFPNLFFRLQHGLAVEGGEPSDWYRAGQKLGRALLLAGIFILALLSFAAY